jgi:hypothetical protein
LLAEKETTMMCTKYIKYVIPEMLAQNFTRENRNKPWFETLVILLQNMIIAGSNEKFEK